LFSNVQIDYVKALASTGKVIVTVIVSGRPRLLHGIAEVSDAVLEAYRPGPMGGQVIAEVCLVPLTLFKDHFVIRF
jgi:beta-glucosidase